MNFSGAGHSNMPPVFAKLMAMEFMQVSMCTLKLPGINKSVTDNL